ncbi:hypothetical protein [Piscinibacter terrae]|nr:hypothetical protein [Albitalea terrae]
MGCCGQGRATLRQATAASRPGEVPDRTMARVLVRYRAQTPVTIRGVNTGRMYRFDGENAQQHVEAGDAQALLGSRFFVKAD